MSPVEGFVIDGELFKERKLRPSFSLFPLRLLIGLKGLFSPEANLPWACESVRNEADLEGKVSSLKSLCFWRAGRTPRLCTFMDSLAHLSVISSHLILKNWMFELKKIAERRGSSWPLHLNLSLFSLLTTHHSKVWINFKSWPTTLLSRNLLAYTTFRRM